SHVRDIRLGRDVTLDAEGAVTKLSHLFTRCLRPFQIRNDHRGTPACEVAGHSKPDTLCAACDQRYLSGKGHAILTHNRSLRAIGHSLRTSSRLDERPGEARRRRIERAALTEAARYGRLHRIAHSASVVSPCASDVCHDR